MTATVELCAVGSGQLEAGKPTLRGRTREVSQKLDTFTLELTFRKKSGGLNGRLGDSSRGGSRDKETNCILNWRMACTWSVLIGLASDRSDLMEYQIISITHCFLFEMYRSFSYLFLSLYVFWYYSKVSSGVSYRTVSSGSLLICAKSTLCMFVMHCYFLLVTCLLMGPWLR